MTPNPWWKLGHSRKKPLEKNHNESHLQYKPPKHKIEEKFTPLIQYKTRYKDPYLQPEECKGKNKQTKKQTLKNEMK